MKWTRKKLLIFSLLILPLPLVQIFLSTKLWNLSNKPDADPVVEKHSLKVPRNAWVVSVVGDSYSKGAMILAHSLRLSKTKHDLVFLTSDKENENTKKRFELLRKFFDRVLIVEPASPDLYDPKEIEALNWLPAYFIKLRTMELIEYDKICIIGADYLVLENIDSVFQCPTPCGAPDTYLFKPNSRSMNINGDMMVLKPSISDLKGLINLLYRLNWVNKPRVAKLNDEFDTLYGPDDQGLLSYYYGSRWTALSCYLGGIQPRLIFKDNPFLWDTTIIKALHFSTYAPRPWEVYNVTLVLEAAIYRETYETYSKFTLNLIETLSPEDRSAFNQLSKVYTEYVCLWEFFSKCSKPVLDSEVHTMAQNYKRWSNFWIAMSDRVRPGLNFTSSRYMAKKRINFGLGLARFFEEKLNASVVR